MRIRLPQFNAGAGICTLLISCPTFGQMVESGHAQERDARPVVPVGSTSARPGLGVLQTFPEAPVEAEAPPRYGGPEFRVGLNGMSFFSRTPVGATLELSYRWPGTTGEPDGHFSIGLQGGFWPSVGQWRTVSFDIGSISSYRLNNSIGEDGSVRFGSVVVQANELFLIGKEDVPIRLYGTFYINPVTNNIFEFTRTRISNMRTNMAAVNVPIRWYFGQQNGTMPRFFLEGGVGLDLLFVKADYEVITRGIRYDAGTGTVQGVGSTTMGDSPLNGEVSKNLFFSHGSIGCGVSKGRFMLSGQARFFLAQGYTVKNRDFSRVRGNIFVVPVIAGASEDPAIAGQLERDGIIPYGRTDLTKTNDKGSVTDNADLAYGVSKFWDTTDWSVGLSFLLR